MKTNKSKTATVIGAIVLLCLFIVKSFGQNANLPPVDISCPSGVYGSCNTLSERVCHQEYSAAGVVVWEAYTGACAMGGSMSDCCDSSMEYSCQ